MPNETETDYATLVRLLKRQLELDPHFYGRTEITIDWKDGNICGGLLDNKKQSIDWSILKQRK